MATIDAAERLLNLVIALSHARVRMTRMEIRQSVAGYDPIDQSLSTQEAAKRDAAFERMFERDKDDLRRMGVPIRTVTDAAHGDDIGYKIDASDAAMPPIDLTAGELAVLGLAAEYWQGATLGADARQGLTKVASAAAHHPRVTLPLAARSTASQDATAALIEAIQDRQAVTFEYASATSGTSVRSLQPWRIVLRGGSEYVVGLDTDRGQPRTFRIGRIHGPVRGTGAPGSYEPPADVPVGTWAGVGEAGTAVIALRAEAGHAIRSRGTHVRSEPDWDVYEVEYVHPDALRDEVLGLAGAARVVEPVDMAQAVAAYAHQALEVTDG
ncbi:MAG: WYL domain-containing protein [Demequina sp.]